MMSKKLSGRLVAVPESRALDILCQMLEQHGAKTLRCPMVGIRDTSDRRAVEDWISRFIKRGFDDFIIYTGEGLRRILGFAQRMNEEASFIAALERTRKITRGPKPVKALSGVGLKTDLRAIEPTTDGLIATLRTEELNAHLVGLQLYGRDPNEKFVSFLEEKGAHVDVVAPYVYIPTSEASDVANLIGSLAAGDVDVIAFTSAPQVERLSEVAQAYELVDQLEQGLDRTHIAAIGPVVAGKLEELGAPPDTIASEPYSLKPLVKAIIFAIANDRP